MSQPTIAANRTSFVLNMASADVLLIDIWTSLSLSTSAVFSHGSEYNFFLVAQPVRILL